MAIHVNFATGLKLLMLRLAALCCLSQLSTCTHHTNFTVALIHRTYSMQYTQHWPNKTSEQRLRRAVEENRLEALVHAQSNQYIVELGLGTPPVRFPAMIDTGSDLIWAPCNPNQCNDDCRQNYSPVKSSTPTRVSCKIPLCKALPSSCTNGCQYRYSYGYGNSSSNGILLFETLTFPTRSNKNILVSHIALGCSYEIQGIPRGIGFIGLGRGPLSLVSQLGSKINYKFSYCLVSNKDAPSKTSHLIFGDPADGFLSEMKSTPLIQNPVSKTASYYYVGLDGISVGGKLLDIPAGAFDFKSDGSGGLIMDTGSQLTYLDSRAYDPLKKAVHSLLNLPQVDGSNLGLDLCYQLSSTGNYGNRVNAPDVVFHFLRGAGYTLAEENYLVEINNMMCLTMVPSRLGFSIIGAIQQQNFHILYDNSKKIVSFAPRNCEAM
eukprot:Gb_02537 [translate_table: standard]